MHEGVQIESERPSWSSRVVFWLAAVGSAVGLGNLWRFPWQCAKWGGGPFLVAYFIALILLGMPVLLQELALGQKFRSGDIEAFGRIHPRLRGIGFASILGVFTIVTYYTTVIGASLVFFIVSFRESLPYGAHNTGYWTTIIGVTNPSNSDWSMNGHLFLCTLLVWIIIFACIFRGVRSASWAVKLTMPLPLLFILILLIHGATLDGASDGIAQYLDFTKWEPLRQTGIWNAAIGQVFFSLSICMGVMTAYASYNPVDQDTALDEKVISFLDVAVSFLSGFVVYSMLGYLVKLTGDQSFYSQASFGLVFVAYPTGVATFSQNGGAQVLGICFFATLFLLGIDSAFSMVEAVTTVVHDSDLGRMLGWSRERLSATCCVVGAAFSTIYCFDSGLIWLDIVDRYINNYGMVFIGACECIAVGWFYRIEDQYAAIGESAVKAYNYSWFLILLLVNILSFTLSAPQEGAGGVYNFDGGAGGTNAMIVGLCVGLGLWLIVTFVCLCMTTGTEPIGKKLWLLAGWHGSEELRRGMNLRGVGENWEQSHHTLSGECYAMFSCSGVWFLWGFLIKYFCPVILSLVLIDTMRQDTYNAYEGYESKHLALGVVIFSAMVIFTVGLFLFPQILKQDIDDQVPLEDFTASKRHAEIEGRKEAEPLTGGATEDAQVVADADDEDGTVEV